MRAVLGGAIIVLLAAGQGFAQTTQARKSTKPHTTTAPTPKSIAGLPLPGGARLQEDGRIVSPWGYRDTVRFYRKRLRGQVRWIPTEEFRGVVFTRGLPLAPETSSFQAVHVSLAQGKTTIYILPR